MGRFHRILQIARKEFLELYRNAGVVAFILAIPIVEMAVLGYATAGHITNLPAAICDSDNSAASRSLAQAIHHSQGFDVIEMVGDTAEAERQLEAGRISVVFLVPRGFERALDDSHSDAVVSIIVDGSNTAVAGYASAYAEGVIAQYSVPTLQMIGGPPVNFESRIWYNEQLRRENFYIPGLLGTMLSLVVLAITAISIVRERERGTLEQLMVAPVGSFELIVGKLVPSIVIAYSELAIMLTIATLLFKVPIRGSLLLYAGLMFIYLLAEMGIGILISTLASSQAQALPTIFLWVTTCGILAGFITPVETMPPMAQWAAALVPLRYFTTISRDLFAKAAGFLELRHHLYPLIGMAAASFAASGLLLRRRSA
jgi:ABC-2 type transport system permease protein